MAKSPAPRKDPTPRPRAARSRTTPGGDSPVPSADAAEQRTSAPDPRHNTPEPAVTPVSEAAPSRDEIAQRAYEIYRARGGTHGTDLEDWLQAERELREAGRKAS